MSGDEMFENIGYVKSENHKERAGQGEFTTQDCPYIEYRSKDDTYFENIKFNLLSHTVIAYAGRINCAGTFAGPLSVREIKAIAKKIEELGWTDEN